MVSISKEIKSLQLDCVRTWGIIFLIFIHINPPRIIWQVFNFNVVLLVLVSGATFALIYDGRRVEHLPYFKKRLVALLVPFYIFLSIYFTTALVSSHFFHIPTSPYGQSYIIKSFLCYRSLGIIYSWILAVYLIIALTAPGISRLNNIVKKNSEYFFIIFLLYGLNELLILLLRHNGCTLKSLSDNYLFFIIPYSCLFAIGARLHKCSLRHIIWSALILLVLFGFWAMKLAITRGHFVWTQEYKYPPQGYYLIYSLAASLCVYSLFRNVTHCPGHIKNFVFFVSRSSLWIFLWHIAVVHIIQSKYTHLSVINDNFILAWVLAIVCSSAITFFQKKIVSSLVPILEISPKAKDYLKIIFL